ncbi:MarR family winged helix-turn-helix transcriptional regulator [Bradyrhizobium sp. 2TAF24]|uniref:MarR family winged helix-turn-helix transcriptional regulator n=1 Tax=Bradyrhizobium sp. 2TAF24 TaxID=3233011 RepID=UPI003F8DCC29
MSRTEKPTVPSEPATTQAAPRLSDFLCFAIYSANLAYGRAYRVILEELGLTYPQYIAIVSLWEDDNQTVSGLGEKMFLESNTLTPILKKLEAMGYVRRQRDSGDERVVRVSLTDAGRRLREKGLTMNLVEASGLKPDEFTKMQKGVVTLRDNLLRHARGDDQVRGAGAPMPD